MPGHKCKNMQLYLMIMQEDDQKELEGMSKEVIAMTEDDKVITEQNPYLSLHALEGTVNYQTMRVRGSVGKKMLYVLIDTESTHNFISCSMAAKLGYVLEEVKELRVMAVNREDL